MIQAISCSICPIENFAKDNSKKVRFPHYTTNQQNDNRSVGAKSAPPINRRSDNESEPSDDQEQITSDNSSQESGQF